MSTAPYVAVSVKVHDHVEVHDTVYAAILYRLDHVWISRPRFRLITSCGGLYLLN
jgi:hypothetical protein